MGKTVMVVDNNTDITNSIKKGLESSYPANYSVVSADSGEKCLELLENNCPDVILLEIMMPGMNGWEIFDRLKLKDVSKNIPIVFMSSRTDRVAKSAGSFLGEEYIEKPFEIADLKEKIDRVLAKK